MPQDVTIRTARPGDAGQLIAIYAPYVVKTAITFDYDVPTEDEFRARMARTLERYPYLVAERDGELMGYAFAGTFKDRAAYDWSVELTIYLRQDARGQGLGRLLYGELEHELRGRGIRNLYACVAYPPDGVEDEHLTMASVRFHERLGFAIVGTFHRCGRKFGRWYDMVWMEKLLAE